VVLLLSLCVFGLSSLAQNNETIFKPGRGFVNEQRFSGIGLRLNANKSQPTEYLKNFVAGLNAEIAASKQSASGSYSPISLDLPIGITPVISLSSRRSRLEITDRSGPMRVVDLEYGAEYSLDEIPCSPDSHPVIGTTTYSGPLIVQGATRLMTHANLDYLLGYKAGNAVFVYTLGGVSVDALRVRTRPMYEAISISAENGIGTDPSRTPRLRYIGGMEFATQYQVGVGGIVGNQNVLMAGYGGKFSGGNALRRMMSTTGGWSDDSDVAYLNNPIAGLFFRFSNPKIQATGSYQRRNFDRSHWAACSVLIRVSPSFAVEASARTMTEGRGTVVDDDPTLILPSHQISIGAQYVIPKLKWKRKKK
jgi:hypothetical protein